MPGALASRPPPWRSPWWVTPRSRRSAAATPPQAPSFQHKCAQMQRQRPSLHVRHSPEAQVEPTTRSSLAFPGLQDPRVPRRGQTYPPLSGRDIPTIERHHSAPSLLCRCGDQPLKDLPVRPRPPSLYLWGVADPASLGLCTGVDDLCDRGREVAGAKEGVVNPPGWLPCPGVRITFGALWGVGRVVRSRMSERDQFEVGAVLKNLICQR